MKKVEISIIIPTYNSSKYLEKSIDSVLKQTFKNYEVFIIDDNSSDDTREILKKYENFKNINLIFNNKKIGAGLSRNKGIKKAKGRFITFLDSDDWWDKEFLEKTIHFIRSNNYDLVYSNFFWTNEKGKILSKFLAPPRVEYKDLLVSNPISCLTRMYDTKSLGKVYMPKIKIRQDYVMCLNILKKVKYAYGLNKTMSYRRFRENSLSQNKFLAAFYQFCVYMKYERLNFLISIKYLLKWAFFGVKKYSFNLKKIYIQTRH